MPQTTQPIETYHSTKPEQPSDPNTAVYSSNSASPSHPPAAASSTDPAVEPAEGGLFRDREKEEFVRRWSLFEGEIRTWGGGILRFVFQKKIRALT